MPKDIRYVTHSGTTDAGFRAYILAIRQMIEACGCVRTTDTGQIDPTTVVKPSSTSQLAGYDVFRFDDELQATHPVTFRIDYRSSSQGGGDVWTIRVANIGLAGTNGAGTQNVPNFNNSGMSPQDLAPMNQTGTQRCFACGDSEDGRIWWLRHGSVGSSSDNQGFSIERTRDIDGNITPDGVITEWWSNQSHNLWFLSYDAVYKAMGSRDNLMLIMSLMPSTSNGIEVPVAPFIYCFKGEWFQTANLYGKPTDFLPFSPVVLERFGDDQTYITFADGSTVNHPLVHSSVSGGGVYLMRFESDD